MTKINKQGIERQMDRWGRHPDIIKTINKTNVSIVDNHHIVPVSLNGDDRRYNKQEIRRPAHDLIHKVLNIQMNHYSKETRKIKMKTNHLIVANKEFVDGMYTLQKKYFSKLNELPPPIVDIHNNKMEQTVGAYEAMARNMGLDYSRIEHDMDFDEKHERLYEVRMAMTQEVIKTLREKYK